MVTECWAIIILIVVMAGVFYRGRKPAYAVMSLPLAIVPLSHLFSFPLARMIVRLDTVSNEMFVRICIHVLGLIVTCFLVGGLSRNLPTRRARRAFMVISGIFTFCITAVLIYSIL